MQLLNNQTSIILSVYSLSIGPSQAICHSDLVSLYLSFCLFKWIVWCLFCSVRPLESLNKLIHKLLNLSIAATDGVWL